MTSKEAKTLIGKPIKYTKIHSSYVHWCQAVILDVKGKNVMVEEGGMNDWLWLPDVRIVPLDTEIQP